MFRFSALDASVPGQVALGPILWAELAASPLQTFLGVPCGRRVLFCTALPTDLTDMIVTALLGAERPPV